MKYSDVLKKYVGKRGKISGNEIDGFCLKVRRGIGHNGVIREVMDDCVFFEITEKSLNHGEWYCHISKFFIHDRPI